MRIAFVSQPRDPIAASGSQWGSVAIVTWELARRLARTHEVTVYAPRAPSQPDEERGPDGVLVRRTPRVRRLIHKALDLGTTLVNLQPPYFALPMFFREYGEAVAEMLARDGPDVVHVQSWSHFIPIFRRALPDARVVLHTHDALLTRLDRVKVEHRLAVTDAVVTCSDFITREWRSRFPGCAERIHTIGNGVDLEHFTPARLNDASVAPPRILYIGRISPDKGVHILVRAFDALLERRPDAELIVAGPLGLLPYNQVALCETDPQVAAMRCFYGAGVLGRLRKQVLGARDSYLDSMRASVRASTWERIRFLGSLEHRDLPEHYRGARLLAAPSVWQEPFGLPIAEGMASGLPVVATYAGGIPELVEDGVTGRLVERGDALALSRALQELLDDPARATRMGRAARARAERLFGWEGVVQRLDAVYQQLTPWRMSTVLAQLH